MRALDDPAYPCDPTQVRAQYVSETNLAARASLYAETTGPFAGDVVHRRRASRHNVVLVADR